MIVSDTRSNEEPQVAVKETLKRMRLRCYISGLVAGSQSRAYLENIGFPREAIFQPWDVVDNVFFAKASSMATQPEHPMQEALDPQVSSRPHFLCISRFIPKKNLLLLLEAYGDYLHQGGRWGLRLMGGGPLEATLRLQLAELPPPERVRASAFEQFEAVRRSYSQASALVLVSNACGCHADLVQHGVSGWSFEAVDRALLRQVERQNPANARRWCRPPAFAWTPSVQKPSGAACRKTRSGPLPTHANPGVGPWGPNVSSL